MMETTHLGPKAAGFSQPAEWEFHESCWLAWPSDAELWLEDLKPAQDEFVGLCRAIAAPDSEGNAQGERLDILVPNEEKENEARAALTGVPAHFHHIPFGDIWLRDTGPIFLKNADGEVGTVRFGFNGWGEKYHLPHDPEVALAIVKDAQVGASGKVPSSARFSYPWILEGGSVEVDGEGTCLTTRQCLLNPNRNASWTAADAEAALLDAFGLEKVIWLEEGLVNDHTDGHIDTLARFVAPGVVVCMRPSDADDPNFEALESIMHVLSRSTDARGRRLKVVTIPSPGEVTDLDGEILPASYLNFYIGNRAVVVPTYGSRYDEAAVSAIAELFPDRKTVGLSAKAILTGGGAFHCISQQQPAAGTKKAK